MSIREYTVACGDYMRVHLFPVRRKASGKRGKRCKPTSEVQARLNQVNRQHMFSDILALNFSEGDYFLRLSYKQSPESIGEAERMLRNYIRRLKAYRKKMGISGEFKYAYVTECGKKSGRIHHHVFLPGDMPRAELERIWGLGYANCGRVQLDETGWYGLAYYALKSKREKTGGDGDFEISKRSWNCSKNLRRPEQGHEIRHNDYRIHTSDVRYINQNPDDFSFIGELYPDYFAVDVKSCAVQVEECTLLQGNFVTIYLHKK